MSDAKDPGPVGARPSLIKLSNFDPAFRADPYSRYAHLREFGAIVQGDAPTWAFVGAHASAYEVLRDPSLAVDPATETENPYVTAQRASYLEAFKQVGMVKGVNGLDGAAHTRARSRFTLPFLKRAEAFRPKIEEIVADLIQGLRGRAEFDILTDFANDFTMRTITGVLGIPERDGDELRIWSDNYRMAQKPRLSASEKEEQLRITRDLWVFLQVKIAERKQLRHDDYIGDLVEIQQREASSDAPISDAELMSNVFGLLAASHPTVADLIANGMWLLLSRPDALRKLRANPSLMSSAIEEILRYEPPAMATTRVNTRDQTIDGCPLRAGDLAVVFLAAANRDPETFPDPDEFDIARKPNRHLAFGGGVHLCPGAALSRHEAKVGMGELLTAFPGMRLPDGFSPKWRRVFSFRGLENLPVQTL